MSDKTTQGEAVLVEAASFRDPSGFIFRKDGQLYRQINRMYQSQYERLMSGGLYRKLIKKGWMVPHEEAQFPPMGEDGFLVIKPQVVDYISYPYEWCFGQIKDAALLTLRIHKMALEHDMILKDASAYNIQFMRGRPLLIDTLSFEMYTENTPWVAYGQFCRHFLAPLYLMAYTDIRLNQLYRVYIDGVPLDLASKLLGKKGGLGAKQHIHWHAKSLEKYGTAGHSPQGKAKQITLSKKGATDIIDMLIRTVEALELKKIVTEWGDYYARTNYTADASQSKADIVKKYIDAAQPEMTWDFGANDGTYSRLALPPDRFVAAFDIDPVAVERNYQAVKRSRENLLPLLLDLTNPSPGIGFAGQERTTLGERGAPDCILMLAVIHHMAISNNLPLPKIAAWLASLCKHLIIEFVPKEDSQVKILLATRDDIFPSYNLEGFEAAFAPYFTLVRKDAVEGSERRMYLMETKEG